MFIIEQFVTFIIKMYKTLYINSKCDELNNNINVSFLLCGIKRLILLNMVVHDKNQAFHYIFGYTCQSHVTIKLVYKEGGKR